jgi:hypothetical protein
MAEAALVPEDNAMLEVDSGTFAQDVLQADRPAKG